MSYLVLARKYRSDTFDDVVGQDHVARTLKKAIESGRVAHAYLFCGTRGVGKTSMARILAKALNCQKSDAPTVKPCGKCSSCVAIKTGQDLDVIEIDAASNTQVEKTREIIDNAQFRPAHSRFKVYIIDEVHMLSKASFNALLKTLEEPPEHVKFILATTEAEKILPTILSRCQRYDFRNIPTREITKHLQEICREEKIKADEDALALIAKAGAGSMRDSLSLLDRLLSVGEKQLTIDLIEQTLGMPRTQAIFDIAEAMGHGDVKAVLEQTDKLVNGGLSADTLIASLTDHLRNLLILRTCGVKSNLVEIAGMSIDELNEQAQMFETTMLTQDIAMLEELRRTMRSSQASRAMLDATLVRLALAEQFVPINDLLDRTDSRVAAPGQKKKSEPVGPAPVRQAIAPEPRPVAASTTDSEDDDALPAVGKVWKNDSGPSLSEMLKVREAAEPVASDAPPIESNIEPVGAHNLPDVWNRLITALSERGPSLPALLSGAKLVDIDATHATLKYPRDHESVVRMLERNGKKDTIRDVLSGLLSQNVGLKFEYDDAPTAVADAPSESSAPARMIDKRVQRSLPPRPAAPPPPQIDPGIKITEELRKELSADPLIKAVIDELGGEIVKVET